MAEPLLGALALTAAPVPAFDPAFSAPATPSDDRSAPEAAWASAVGSAGASAFFLLFALLPFAGLLRPPGFDGALSRYSASAGPMLFLAALERPG